MTDPNISASEDFKILIADAKSTKFYHTVLKELHAGGDIILHVKKSHIVAISTVVGSFRTEFRKGKEYNVVDLNCTLLENFVDLRKFRAEIIKACKGVKYASFDKNGNGNRGYVYALPKALIKLFFNEITRTNQLKIKGKNLFIVSQIDKTYFEWINPDFHKNSCLENVASYVTSIPHINDMRELFITIPCLRDALIERCKVKFVDKTEIAKYQKDNLENIFPKEEFDNNNDIFTKLLDAVELCNNIENFNISFRFINNLKERLINGDISNADIKMVYTNIKYEFIPSLNHIIQNITEDVEKLKESEDTNHKQKLAKKKDDINQLNNVRILLELLCEDLSKIQRPGELLGLYIQEQKTILLCLQNIFESADSSISNAKRLAESVLVHEFTHHIHLGLLSYNLKNCDEIQKDAVLETVAETVQYLFAIKIDEQFLIDWMNRHSKSGVFPGWGYAGENILRELVESIFEQNKDYLKLVSDIKSDSVAFTSFLYELRVATEKNLLCIILDMTLTDLKKAYYLLELPVVLKDLYLNYHCGPMGHLPEKYIPNSINVEFICDDQSVTYYDNIQIWFFSKQFLSFPQSDLKKKTTVQKEKIVNNLKQKIIKIFSDQINGKIVGSLGDISDLIRDSSLPFYAEYASSYECNSDIDNILLYNFQQNALLSRLMRCDTTLRIVKMPDINSLQYHHYYHYIITGKGKNKVDKHERGNLLCEFTSVELADWNNNVGLMEEELLEIVFISIKRANNISILRNANEKTSLWLELTVAQPKGGNNIKRLSPNIFKKLIDGTICALHKPKDVIVEAVNRIFNKRNVIVNNSEIMSCFSSDKHKNTKETFPLSERVIVKPYRDYIKWNPADEMIKYVQIRVKEQDDSTLTISGKLFEM